MDHTHKIERYRDAALEWRTRITDLRNGKIILPTEGYKNLSEAIENLGTIERVIAAADLSPLDDKEEILVNAP